MNPRPFSPQRFHNMASTSSAKEFGRQLPPPYLSPPEEAVYANFSQDVSPSPTQTTWQPTKLPPINPRSPPASPSASTPICHKHQPLAIRHSSRIRSQTTTLRLSSMTPGQSLQHEVTAWSLLDPRNFRHLNYRSIADWNLSKDPIQHFNTGSRLWRS